jgi:hypothetical protein
MRIDEKLLQVVRIDLRGSDIHGQTEDLFCMRAERKHVIQRESRSESLINDEHFGKSVTSFLARTVE